MSYIFPLTLISCLLLFTASATTNVSNNAMQNIEVISRRVGSWRPKKRRPPSVPKYGPMPWIVKPSSFAPDVKDLPIPQIKPSCSRKSGPVISKFKVQPSFYGPNEIMPMFKIDWCPRLNSLRVRVLSFEYERLANGSFRPRTEVLSNVLEDFLQNEKSALFPAACRKRQIYVEACGLRKGSARPLCVTSEIKEAFAFTPVEPILKRRPPLLLRLGPGDSPLMAYEIGVGNDEKGKPRKYRLQIAAVAKSGRWLGASRWMTGTQVSTRLPLFKYEKGVRPKTYDGAEVFLRFEYTSCARNVATLRKREKSTIAVKSRTSRLVKQDIALPKLQKLVFPPTLLGKPVTLKAHATNPGNGRRADGSPTKLQYQWFKRDFDYGFFPSYPKPLVGETEPVLKLPKAECPVQLCSRYGCSDLKRYSVLVCNTLGCVLSNVVEPNIKPPKLEDWQKWNKRTCQVESCKDPRVYCPGF